jgi:hypothetical protein
VTVVAGEGFRQLSVVRDGYAVQVNMGGGITNLLRMARNECRGLVAFVAASNGNGLEVASFPAGEDAVGHDAVSQLVRLTSADPEFGHGGPFVRTVALDGFLEPVTVAVAPLGAGGEQGLLGVVGHDPSEFGNHQRQVIERVAQRLTRHLKARAEVEKRHGPSAHPQPVPPVDPPGFTPGDRWAEAGGVPDRSSPTAPPGPEEPVVPPWADPRPVDDNALSAFPAAQAARPVVPPVGWSVDDPVPASPPMTPGAGVVPARTPSPDAEAGREVPTTAPDLYAPAWEAADEVTGLSGLGAFFSRTGRIMGGPEPRAVAIVVIESTTPARPEELIVQLAATTLRSQVRASDPVARIGRTSFAVAVALEPGSTLAAAVEQRLAGAVRTALGGATAGTAVRSAHVMAEPEQKIEADELLRRTLRQLRGD